jgi:hypothetical protein
MMQQGWEFSWKEGPQVPKVSPYSKSLAIIMVTVSSGRSSMG